MDDPETQTIKTSFTQKHKNHIIYILLFAIIAISIYFSLPSQSHLNIHQVGGVAPLIAAGGMGGMAGMSKMGGMGGMDMNAMKSEAKEMMQSSGSGGHVEKPKTASALASPISSTFGFVMSVITKILKFIFLFFVIILVPTVPLILYAVAAYFMIKKFLGFFSS